MAVIDYVLVIGELDTRQGIIADDLVGLRSDFYLRNREFREIVVEDSYEVRLAVLRQGPIEANVIAQDGRNISVGDSISVAVQEIVAVIATVETFSNKHGVIDALKQTGDFKRLRGRRLRVRPDRVVGRRIKSF